MEKKNWNKGIVIKYFLMRVLRRWRKDTNFWVKMLKKRGFQSCSLRKFFIHYCWGVEELVRTQKVQFCSAWKWQGLQIWLKRISVAFVLGDPSLTEWVTLFFGWNWKLLLCCQCFWNRSPTSIWTGTWRRTCGTAQGDFEDLIVVSLRSTDNQMI